jgi:4-amino-4-deoxy-L-arabinose transferase-like glycosyltransferase
MWWYYLAIAAVIGGMFGVFAVTVYYRVAAPKVVNEVRLSLATAGIATSTTVAAARRTAQGHIANAQAALASKKYSQAFWQARRAQKVLASAKSQAQVYRLRKKTSS